MSTTYTLHMTCDDGGSETVALDADSLNEARDLAATQTADWLRGGEWGDDGAEVSGGWELQDADGETLTDGTVTVDIEPNHEALIIDACGGRRDSRADRCCGDSPDDHDWTSEDEGGLAENPGVWSTGGTAMIFASHCRTCGLRRVEHCTGSQRNPGKHDTVEYTMPETWCGE